ncbi:MAG: cobalamin-dependent protein [Eggerthellaceae bacterium]|nr:cobalamin-dependent protein [Eggerthellaceae bacterium]
MSKLTELAACIAAGDIANAKAMTQAAIDEGNAPMDVLNVGLVEPINVLGEEFRLGHIYVPELLVASKAMKAGVEVVKPLLMGEGTSAGKAVFATVEGDMHDIGKNLCVMLLESAGFEVEDLGMDVECDDIIDAVQEDEDVKIVGLSAMLTTTMYNMQDVIEALEEAGLRDRVKVIIGGAPVNSKFAAQIGADGYTENAPTCVEFSQQLISEM